MDGTVFIRAEHPELRVRARGLEPPPPKGPGPKPGASASSATPACVAGPAVYLLLAASATRGAGENRPSLGTSDRWRRCEDYAR